MASWLETLRGLSEGISQGMADVTAGATVGILINQSSSVSAMGGAALKNISYIATENPTPRAALDARGHFLEAGLISFASFVHRFVIFAIYGIAALTQGGSNVELNYMARYSLVHFVISGLCMGAGLVGVISPEYGTRGTTNLVSLLFTSRVEIVGFLNSPPAVA